ncbi:MarR family winged helix-turn-helix transcriptional regulator [Sphingosinithalassobacter portus]|uniref:MarR family winged helix-turn-helix transcriptional regulator n=1 Tax=Stakelama portus TaxID=2676234 RepID=UPI00137B5ACD|nr:MarR family transcriptional regulator [Sphingosinithalassobacter portus]
MRTALEREGYDDIPANGLYIIGRLAAGERGVPISTLVKELGVSKQAVGQLVDTLVTRGYLQRTPDDNDRRQLIITLTQRGRAAADTQTIARRAIDAALLSAVGPVDLDSTRRTLAALIDLDRPAAPEPIAGTGSKQ